MQTTPAQAGQGDTGSPLWRPRPWSEGLPAPQHTCAPEGQGDQQCKAHTSGLSLRPATVQRASTSGLKAPSTPTIAQVGACDSRALQGATPVPGQPATLCGPGVGRSHPEELVGYSNWQTPGLLWPHAVLGTHPTWGTGATTVSQAGGRRHGVGVGYSLFKPCFAVQMSQSQE